MSSWDSIDPHLKLKRILKAIRLLDARLRKFLRERSPFYTCMKYAAFQMLRLSVNDFERMSEAYRKYKDLSFISKK